MSSACLPSPSSTDKKVNVRNVWDGVEGTTAKNNNENKSPAALLLENFLSSINSPRSPPLAVGLSSGFLTWSRGNGATPDRLGCVWERGKRIGFLAVCGNYPPTFKLQYRRLYGIKRSALMD